MRGPGGQRGRGAGGGERGGMGGAQPAAMLLRAQADLLEATQGDGNLNGARAALDKLSRLRNERLLARIVRQQEARAVLTPAQKTKVDNLRQQLRGRMSARRGRGMRQGGMRPGSMRQRMNGGRSQRPPMSRQFGPEGLPPVSPSN